MAAAPLFDALRASYIASGEQIGPLARRRFRAPDGDECERDVEALDSMSMLFSVDWSVFGVWIGTGKTDHGIVRRRLECQSVLVF